ncbi:MAG: hypothetical protein LBI53_03700 [Candidatus Peribacteria bacterium]|nr:hypothetical protein [Candidatus Peribacteria bacterium]
MTDTIVEVQTSKAKNSWGTVAFVFAILGLLLTISVLGAPLGILFLVIALLLGLIGIFFKPRGKAFTSLLISVLILGGMGYFVTSMTKVVVEPVKEFVTWVMTESKDNAGMKVAFAQEGFSVFYQSRIQQKFKDIDWKAFPKEGDWKHIAESYVRFGLEQIKEEILTSVDLWLSEYGYLVEEDILPPVDEEVRDDTSGEEDGIVISVEDIDVLIEENPDQTVHEEIEAILEELE